MPTKPLSHQELRIWNALKHIGQDALVRVAQGIAEATGLSGPDFGVLSRVADLGNGDLRQQTLAESMGWDKSRLSHQLTRMHKRGLIRRRSVEDRAVMVTLTRSGREKLDSARPVHAASVRNLLDRLNSAQIDSILQISESLGQDK